MEYSYRIVKYTSINEVGDICSHPDEWTSFFDVGQKVEKSEYEKVEVQYIDYVLELCELLKINSLNINGLSVNVDGGSYFEGQSICVSQLGGVIRSVLREDIWCKLVSDRCEFHFGYDFYMYFVSRVEPYEFISKIETELTVQKYKSPYLYK